jgi:hypothetical protein
LIGQASVIDGDTLEIHGTRIRLWGIDAPESSQLCRNDESLQYRCGAKAANELDAFIARRPVDCSPVGLDQYRRTVAVCSIDGVDVAEWLVRNGLALDWPRYSKGKYDRAQRTRVSIALNDCRSRESLSNGQVVFPSTGFSGYNLRVTPPIQSVTQEMIDGEKTLVVQGCFFYKSFNVVRHSYFCYFYRAKVSKPENINICTAGHYAD